jgi:hypothetical protein
VNESERDKERRFVHDFVDVIDIASEVPYDYRGYD